MAEKIHIVYCSDAGYLMPTLVSAASAVAHAKICPIVIHLFETGLTEGDVGKFVEKLKSIRADTEVVRHHWDDKRFDMCPAWHGSRIIYARLLVQDLIPEADWAISVDGDTLWLGDPAVMMALKDETKLYQISIDPPDPNGLENPVFQWFRERGLSMDPAQYYCVGAMLMNLKKLREENFSKQALDFLTEYPDPKYPEQMVMCYLAQGKTSPLPKEWGCYSFYHNEIDITKPCLIHYVQDAPWKRVKVIHLMSDICLVWHKFASDVLGVNTISKIPFVQRIWRRTVFIILKHNQWIFKFCSQWKAYFLNTKGI